MNPLLPIYSVVVPFYNEEGAIPGLVAELQQAMDALGDTYELVLIDDGSRDGTAQALAHAVTLCPQCRIITMNPNQGQAGALLRGFAAARGAWIITLDGDGQNSPEDIPKLVETAQREGCDMVVGIRATRRDTWARRVMSRTANRVRGAVLGDHLSDSGCALKLFRREVAQSFWPIRSLYSFMPAFAIAAGFRLTEIPVHHRERRTGKSNYGFGTFAWRPMMDMVSLWWLLRKRPAFKHARDSRGR